MRSKVCEGQKHVFWRNKLNATVGVFGIDVEEKVMETLLYRMKANYSSSKLYSRQGAHNSQTCYNKLVKGQIHSRPFKCEL